MRRNLTATPAGIALAAGTALISGFAVFINGYGVRAWASVSDPTTYTTVKNVVAALVLAGAGGLASRARHSDVPGPPQTWRQRLGLVAIAFIGGSVPFALFFEGLSRATSTQAALIHKSLVVWVAILAVTLLHEKVRWPHLVAVGFLVWGQIELAGGINGLALGSGELMILGATLLWSIEVALAKRLLADLPSLTVGIARMAGGAMVLIAYGITRGAFGDLNSLSWSHLGWVLITGFVLSAYVATWFAALARAPALDVTSVLVGGAIITAFLQTGIRGVPVPSLAGMALIVGGASLVLLMNLRRPEAAL